MTTYYVGSGGSDANAGTSYGARFLTLGKAATSVAAGGDIVYVSPGTYREQLTIGVSGGNVYSTGTVTATNGSAIVAGSGTLFVTNSVAAGHYFKTAGAGAIKIASVDSETQLTLVSAFDGATAAGATYKTWNPIRWIGDYSGANTDGVGGIVRITGSADDITTSRAYTITATSINYNLISGFTSDLASTAQILISAGLNWIVEKCYFQDMVDGVLINGAGASGTTVQNCYFSDLYSGVQAGAIHLVHSSAIDNSGHIVQNCIITRCSSASGSGVTIEKVGGIIIRNCNISATDGAVNVRIALTVGQTTYVNNCIILANITTALRATTAAEITEDYNTFAYNQTPRGNSIAVGANSITYPPLFDTRWFFEATK